MKGALTPMNRPGNREVLECGSPLPLCFRAGATESGRGLPHSKMLSRAGLRPALADSGSLSMGANQGFFP